jgi:hypothetical protein
VQCWLSASFAARYRVRLGMMDRLIPDYRAIKRHIHQVLNDAAGADAPPPPPTWHHLDAMLELARTGRIHVVVVAMPSQERYAIDPEVIRRLDATGMDLIDGRDTPGLTPDRFSDRTHLNAEGAAVFSRALGRRLAARLE